MASMNVLDDVQKVKVENPNHMLGKGLMMPFAASNSGSRKLMFGTQLEHRLPLMRPEVPFIQTGYEMEFGKYSSSYVEAEANLEVIGIVPKFAWIPKHQYYIIFRDIDTGLLSIVERREYKHITENYGYLYDNAILDRLEIGATIHTIIIFIERHRFLKRRTLGNGCTNL